MRETRTPEPGDSDAPSDDGVSPPPGSVIAPGRAAPHAMPDGRGDSVALPPSRPYPRPDIRRATMKGIPPLEARTPVSEHHIERHRSGLLDARAHAPPPPLPQEPPPPPPLPDARTAERSPTVPGMPTFEDATTPGIPAFGAEPGEAPSDAEMDPLRPNTGIGWFLGKSQSVERPIGESSQSAAPPENTTLPSMSAPPLPSPRPHYAPDPMSAPLDLELPSLVHDIEAPSPTPAVVTLPRSSSALHALPDVDLRAERGASGLLAATPGSAPTSALLLGSVAPITHSAQPVPPPSDPHQPFAPPRIVTRIALGVAVALPTANHAPWELLTRPTDVTFLGLVALLMTSLSQLAPSERPDGSPSRLGLWLSFAAALLLLPFATLALVEAGEPFDAQPFIARLGADSALVPAALVLGATLLLAGFLMAGRLVADASIDHTARAPGALPARLGLGLGLTLLLALALLPVGGSVPLAAASGSVADSPFLGDRIAAMAILAALALVPLAVVVAIGPWRRAARALAFGAWAALAAPLVLLSLFVARSSEWLAVLEPLKLSLFVAAIVLFCAHTLDELVAGMGRGSPARPQE